MHARRAEIHLIAVNRPLFVSGADVSPLPVRIYGMLRTGVTPQGNAIGTLMTLVTVVLGIAASAILMRRRRSEP